MASKTEYLVATGLVGAAAYLTWRFVLRKSGDPPPPAAPTPSPIDLTFAREAADAIAAQKKLKRQNSGEEGQTDRHRYFFLFRRAAALGTANPALRSGPGLDTLRQRIAKELDLVAAFLTDLLGTSQARGSYFGGPPKPIDQGQSQRLDPGTFIHSRTIDPLPTTEQESVNADPPDDRHKRTLLELDLRKKHVTGIVWRAAAIETELWKGTDAAPELNKPSLTILLDRRLQTLERLRYQASAGADPTKADGMGSSFIERIWDPHPFNNRSNKEGPWRDGYLVRPFEAPSVPRSARSDDGSWRAEEVIPGKRTRILQRLSITGDPTGGTFKLDFNGTATHDLPFDASADNVKNELSVLATITSANLTVRCRFGDLPQDAITIVLDGAIPPGTDFLVVDNNLTGGTNPKPQLGPVLGDTDVEVDEGIRFNLAPPPPPPAVPPSPDPWYLSHATDEFDANVWPATRPAGTRWNLPQGGSIDPGYGWTVVPPRDTQLLTIIGTPTGGTFALRIGNDVTPDIRFEATADQVLSALHALPNGSTDFACSGGPLPDKSITLEFLKDTRTDDFNAENVQLTGGTNPDATVGSRNRGATDPASKVIFELFLPVVPGTANSPSITRADWWNRSWLHSDGLLAALHIDGLRHALSRQPAQAGGRPDDAFNTLAKDSLLALDDYFHLRHVTWPPNTIMGTGPEDGRREWFQNGAIETNDLQIGDQVLFDTNPALVGVGAIAFDYPTVLVTDVDSSLDAPTVNLNGLRLQGFNSPELDYRDFQLMLAKMADRTLDRIRAFIPAQIDRLRHLAQIENKPFTPPVKLDWDIGGMTVQHLDDESTALRLWNPYGDTWDPPGPWWIWIHLASSVWQGIFKSTQTEVDRLFRLMPRAIAWDESENDITFSDPAQPHRKANAPRTVPTGTGFQDPPWEDDRLSSEQSRKVIFVPLFQPFGGWEVYFETKATVSDPWPSQLTPVKTDARWLAELARSQEKPDLVRVIRPRPKPNA